MYIIINFKLTKSEQYTEFVFIETIGVDKNIWSRYNNIIIFLKDRIRLMRKMFISRLYDIM